MGLLSWCPIFKYPKIWQTHLKVGHPYISCTGARPSNELQRLDYLTGYQDGSSSNGCQETYSFMQILYHTLWLPSYVCYQLTIINLHKCSIYHRPWLAHIFISVCINAISIICDDLCIFLFQQLIKWISWHTINNSTFYFTEEVNSLGPNDAIWRQRSGSTLAQVMACCLTAPSHYLNQCWLIFSKVEWYSSKDKFTRDTSAINPWNFLEN